MGWRVWVVRGLVFGVLGVLAAGVALFVLYTDPTRVRQIVQDNLAIDPTSTLEACSLMEKKLVVAPPKP